MPIVALTREYGSGGTDISNAAKDSVEQIVKSVVGVRSVENQVRVFREW